MSQPEELNLDALDTLEVNEERLAEKQAGGGEALTDAEADCEGCKI
jgi:hypothetical protein